MASIRTVAVVLAGGDQADRLAVAVGAPSKALVPLRGEPMGAYVAHALRHSGVIDELIWVGAANARIRQLVDRVVPGGARMVDSLALGFGAAFATVAGTADAAAGAQRVRILAVGADIPWWDAAGVRAFVEAAPEAGVVYPVVREADALARFPGQQRTYARLRDGRYTGGNAVLFSAAAAVALLPIVDRAFMARKQPWQLASIIGWRTLFAFFTGRATIEMLEQRIGTLLGVSARALITADAAIGADVDNPSHLPDTLSLPELDRGAPSGGIHAST
jgi:CTP:molybdopterin cytidylyltransferase MocA